MRYYGQWMRDEAEKRIGNLYPKVEITPEMVQERPDLKPYEGRKLTVIAWLWARTVKSPEPRVRGRGRTARLHLHALNQERQGGVRRTCRRGTWVSVHGEGGPPADVDAAKAGTKLSRGANFRCLMSGTPIPGDYIKAEGKAGRMSARLMAIVAEGDRGRVYLAPTSVHEQTARMAIPQWRPDSALPDDPRNFWTVQYGLVTHADLFTPRQLVALTTFSDLVQQARERVQRDAAAAGLSDDGKPLRDGGTARVAYADAVGVYLGLAIKTFRGSATMPSVLGITDRPLWTTKRASTGKIGTHCTPSESICR